MDFTSSSLLQRREANTGATRLTFSSKKDQEEKDWEDIPREHRLARVAFLRQRSRANSRSMAWRWVCSSWSLLFRGDADFPVVGTHPPSLVSVRAFRSTRTP